MRSRMLERLAGQRFDVLVVGGGINGAVAAGALAAGGASVALVEQGDFAGLTSQQSSNLVWGGVKYLQSYEMRLVRSLCKSRNELLRAFPSRIRSTPFLGIIDKDAPVGRHLVGAGAYLYWMLGGGQTPLPHVYGPRRAAAIEPMVAAPGLRGAVQYHDARLVDSDARFVWDFIAGAQDRGAVAINYVELQEAERARSGWRVGLFDRRSGDRLEVTADVIVNAAGPLATRLSSTLEIPTRHRLVLSKGVHLVVPRLIAQERVVAMFDDDNRPFYIIPMHDRSMIGTTDTRVDSPDVRVETDDRDYLLEQVNRRLMLDRPLTAGDVVAERAGVRPLVVSDSGSDASSWLALSRRHEVETDPQRRVVTILGGKITDCVNVGNEVCAEVAKLGVEVRPSELWYGEDESLYRAAVERLGREAAPVAHGINWPQMLQALWRRQGAKALGVIAAWKSDPANAEELYPGTQLTRAELALIAGSEHVVTLEDLFRRRTLLSQIRPATELRDNPATMELASMIEPRTARTAVQELFA